MFQWAASELLSPPPPPPVTLVELLFAVETNPQDPPAPVVEEVLFRWHDSIAECHRRGLRDSTTVKKLARTYLAIEEVEQRIAT